MTKLCTVFGNPIEQSKSPLIHSMFAEQFAMALEYGRTKPELTDFESAVTEFFSQQEAVGANVTLPFKERAFELADESSSQAKRAGAVNTLYKKHNIIYGDNTDGRGLVGDLLRNNVMLSKKSILLIGAGGAARGALPALLDADVNSIHIHNRTTRKTEKLIEDIADAQNRIKPYERFVEYDIIINATSLSLQNKVPALPTESYRNNPVCYDMVYLPAPTTFMQFANLNGAELVFDGLGMLVSQAAESFHLWFNVMPDVEQVLKTLR